jgi:hypothetical protein
MCTLSDFRSTSYEVQKSSFDSRNVSTESEILFLLPGILVSEIQND